MVLCCGAALPPLILGKLIVALIHLVLYRCITSRSEEKDETLEFGRLIKEKALEKNQKSMTFQEHYEQRKNMNLMTELEGPE